jgi:CRP/FNR family transcriptional regulator, cyclic AMP receptor protein
MNSPYGLPIIDNCLICNLRCESFFCSLPLSSLAAFDRLKQTAMYPEGAVIFVEGQPARGIFLICQGQAKLSTTSRDGKILIMRMASAGEVLGLDATVCGTPYELTVETMRPCQLAFVGRDDFMHFLSEHGDACLHAAQHLSHECHAAYEVIKSIGLSHSVSERIAKLFIELAAEGKVSNGEVRVKVALTHQEISQLVNTTRETVTRTLTDFKKRQLAELKGSTLIIHNKAGLEGLIGS